MEIAPFITALIELPALIAIVWGSALTGDLTSAVLGRRLGGAFLLTHGHLVRPTPGRLAKVSPERRESR